MKTESTLKTPWECDTAGQPIIINDAEGNIVATIYDETAKPDKATYCGEEEEAASNARLLVAAPDLLAKLQRLLGVAELNVDDMEPETRAAVREASALCAELE